MFNFVFISTPVDYYDIAYADIKDMPNVRYLRNILEPKNPFLKVCFKVHFYFQYRSRIYNPFKSIWNRFLFKNDFPANNPLCFIFNERMLYLDNYGFIDYLRATYPDARLVCYLQDIADSIHNVKVSSLLRKFDLSISYDKGDATRYGISYYPTPYSYYPLVKKQNLQPVDVYFMGKAKNRLTDLLTIYKQLIAEGLKCDFYISGVHPKDQFYGDGIHYNTYLTYEENLQHVMNAKCLLEVMQAGATGYTFRTWEAIMYNKPLLTNNTGIKESPFYKSKYIQVFTDSSSIDMSFIKAFPQEIDYQYNHKLSPVHLLTFIESELNQASR